MMALGVIGAVVSGVVGFMGAQQQAEAAARAAEQNARIAEYNRQVAERNKLAALAASDSEAQDQTRQNTRQLSQIRAAYGASGLSLEGSPLDVLEDTALEQELDVQKTRYKGQLKAIGYADEAENFKMKAELHRMEASDARKSGQISAIGAFLGGITKAGSSLMRVG